MSELLSVRDLTLGFHTDAGLARVLDGASLRIAKGEVMGLVGESGCGKTTLARAVLGVLPQHQVEIERGEIVFNGRDLLKLDAETLASEVRGRRITFIPQDPYGSFNPVFTVGTQIMEIMKWKSPRRRDGGIAGRLPPLLRPYPKAQRRADREKVMALLDAVQLPQPAQILRKYPAELSGGQRQRLMIAMALLPEPDLVIADEPTTALDVTIQAQILGLIRRLATERGVAVLFTTHDLGTAYEICDAVTVMYAGQDVEAAPTEIFFSRQAHPYTSRLIKSLPTAQGTATGIPGEVPSLVQPPPGCRFHPRCTSAAADCRAAKPPETALAAEHRVRCYHPVESAA